VNGLSSQAEAVSVSKARTATPIVVPARCNATRATPNFPPRREGGTALTLTCRRWCRPAPAALNEGLERFVTATMAAGFPDAATLAEREGAGSAGGIGYACLLLGATQVSRADYFLDLLDLNTRKDSCGFVITGESPAATSRTTCCRITK
jgi:hypothetical protein